MVVGESSCSYSEIELSIFSLFIPEIIGFVIWLQHFWKHTTLILIISNHIVSLIELLYKDLYSQYIKSIIEKDWIYVRWV